MNETMKAIVYDQYGPPEVLRLVELPKPVPRAGEILVRVAATTVRTGDWRMRKADPVAARVFNGLLKPRRVRVLGFEFSGVVEAVGKDTSRFAVGEQVFGACGLKFGSYAEYRRMSENDVVALKPANMDLQEAAAVPSGALGALCCLRDGLKLQRGGRLLVYGASGSVGSYAVQLANYFGAVVTGVCSTTNLDMVKTLGAERVVDYTKEDLCLGGEVYDYVFDAVGRLPKPTAKVLLAPGGRFASIHGTNYKERVEDLIFVKALVEAGRLRAVIDKTYTLDQIVEAHRYVETGRKKGNVVIRVSNREDPL